MLYLAICGKDGDTLISFWSIIITNEVAGVVSSGFDPDTVDDEFTGVCGSLGQYAAQALYRTRFTVSLNGLATTVCIIYKCHVEENILTCLIW